MFSNSWCMKHWKAHKSFGVHVNSKGPDARLMKTCSVCATQLTPHLLKMEENGESQIHGSFHGPLWRKKEICEGIPGEYWLFKFPHHGGGFLVSYPLKAEALNFFSGACFCLSMFLLQANNPQCLWFPCTIAFSFDNITTQWATRLHCFSCLWQTPVSSDCPVCKKKLVVGSSYSVLCCWTVSAISIDFLRAPWKASVNICYAMLGQNTCRSCGGTPSLCAIWMCADLLCPSEVVPYLKFPVDMFILDNWHSCVRDCIHICLPNTCGQQTIKVGQCEETKNKYY